MKSLSALLCLLTFATTAPAQYVGPQANQKVAFLGDSITQLGWDSPGGYLHLIDAAMKAQGHPITVQPAGISGQTSKDMLARIGSVLAQKPDWMLMSCGVNDVWHGVNGVPLDQYKINITSMVDQARAANIKVVVLASTPIGFDNPADANNTKLRDYNAFLLGLATKDNLIFVDLNKAMQDACTAVHAHDPKLPGQVLTMDGVHPNVLGFEVMSQAILKAWGFTDAQLTQAYATWQAMPVTVLYNQIAQLDNGHGMDLKTYLAVRALASSDGTDLNTEFFRILDKAMKQTTDSNPPNQLDPTALGVPKSQ